MSRTAAKGKTHRKTGEVLKEGLISRESMNTVIHANHVELRGADVDEAPAAYKRLIEVLQYQGPTIKILHTLKPLGVAMASPIKRF